MNPTGTFLATLKSTSADTKAPNGSFDAILSVPTVDRDGEVLDAGCFNPLPEHITIDLDHAMSVEKTIGSGRPYYDGAILRFSGTYASTRLAQMTRTLVDEGHIRTMSVAYMGAQYETDETDGRPHLRKAELLNAGIVGIPSNRHALITASKAMRAADLADALTLAFVTADAVRAAEDMTSTATRTPESKDAAAAPAAAATLPTPAADAVGCFGLLTEAHLLCLPG